MVKKILVIPIWGLSGVLILWCVSLYAYAMIDLFNYCSDLLGFNPEQNLKFHMLGSGFMAGIIACAGWFFAKSRLRVKLFDWLTKGLEGETK